MTSIFSTIAALSAVYAGMSGLCLAMERHFGQVFRKEPTLLQQRRLRAAGWLLLGIALYFSMQACGGVIGPFAFIGVLTAMTFPLVFLMTYQSRFALPMAGVSLALFLLAGAISCVAALR